MSLPKTTKIILVGNYEADRQTSMLRYAEVLRSELLREGFDAELIQPAKVARRFYGRPDGVGKWLGYVDKYLLFPRQLARRARNLGAEGASRTVFHICDHSNSVYLRWLGSFRHLVTCHDMLAIRPAMGEVPGVSIRLTGRILQRRILQGLKNSRTIACVSEQTRDELARVAKFPPERLTVIHNCLTGDYAPMTPPEAGAILDGLFGARSAYDYTQGGYILHVGSNAWYKNRMGVIRIFHELRMLMPSAPRLFMVGPSFTTEMASYVRDHGLAPHIGSMAKCEDRELNALYSGAKLLLFPSLAEGFGYPIIEAQACGCPVATSNRMPMMEVGGAGALYIDPDNTKEAALRVKVFLDEGLASRQKVEAEGLKNAARFDRKTIIRRYIEAYFDV